jgi:hypothetical protein
MKHKNNWVILATINPTGRKFIRKKVSPTSKTRAIIRTKVFTNFEMVKFKSQNVNIPTVNKIFATAKSKNVVIYVKLNSVKRFLPVGFMLHVS